MAAQTTSPTAEAAGLTAVEARRPVDTDVAGLGRGRAGAFVAPAMVLIATFLVFPALWMFYISATNYRLTGVAARLPSFVGFDNYTTALSDASFHNALLLALIFVFGSAVVGQNALGFWLAWTLRSAPGFLRRVLEALVLLAWIIPSSVVAFLWIAMLDRDAGSLNVFLGTPGLAWLIDYPMLSIIVFNIWRGAAFSMLLYSAALAAVPPSQLETARLVGASGWQTLRDVVFPQIRGHVLTNTLLITLWTFNDFTPFLLTKGGPDHRTETLPVYIYNTAITGGGMGYGAAISVIMLLVNLVLAVLYLRLLRARTRQTPAGGAGLTAGDRGAGPVAGALAGLRRGMAAAGGSLAERARRTGGAVSGLVAPARRVLAPARKVIGRIAFYAGVAAAMVFFAIPMLWLLGTPFDAEPTYALSVPDVTLANFQTVWEHQYALGSLWNALVLALGTAVIVVACAALAAYALSRVQLPGRNALLYGLLLLSSIVTGTAAMVPIFILMDQLDLINTHSGVILVFAGGLLPAAIFILKDFVDAIPRSYEESARVFGASPGQVLRQVVAPVIRPGLATIGVWTIVNVWGNFLVPFLLMPSTQEKQPAAVLVRTFYTEGGGAKLGLISAFSLLYAIPVVAMYLIVNRRYGFRFHGGIKS